jgi:hypothetical protein
VTPAHKVVPVVGELEHLLDWIGLTVLRAVCGELLVAASEPADRDAGAPTRTRCADVAGWHIIDIEEFYRRST